ncbi:MAG: AgmX/PglI C-terminal domain-containing protein [Myxococcota bacterium]|nr:AgmX/PglI C-terminal domain-containing protein [Myxococcota bacterium]
MKSKTRAAITMFGALVLLSACKSNPEKTTAIARTLSARIPTVDIQETTGVPSGPPPLLVLLDGRGQVSIAAGPTSWPELSSFDAVAVAKQVAPEDADRLMRLAQSLRWTPQQAIARMDQQIDLSEIPPDEGSATAPRSTSVPKSHAPMASPPPPPPPPPSGEPPPHSSEQLEAQARDELAAAAGGFGGRLGTSEDFEREGGLARFADVVGEVRRDRKLGSGSRGIVLAEPRTKAADLIAVVGLTESLIGVSHAGRVSPLRIDFRHRGVGSSPWTEVRISGAKLVIEAVPDDPVELAWSTGKLDGAALTNAIANVRKRGCGHSELTPVDVLVDSTIDVQRLIDVLVALDQSGVRAVGLGSVPKPDGEQAKIRGHGRPRFQIQLSRFDAPGMKQRDALDVLRSRQDAFETCYATTLKEHPEVGGTLVARFAIIETGEVVEAKVEFTHDQLARCIVAALGFTRFPRPPGRRTEATAWMQLSPDTCRQE